MSEQTFSTPCPKCGRHVPNTVATCRCGQSMAGLHPPAVTPPVESDRPPAPSAVAAADRIDVWFAPGYTAPLRIRAPLVVAVHDVSFVAHPEWFRMREGVRRRFICRRSVAAARAVVTISEFSKREIVERLNVAAQKIHVIPPTISPQPLALSPRGPKVLFVGSIFNRRHVPDLIRAFAPIARAHADASLDIVGDDRTYPREDLPAAIAAEGLQQQVQWHRYVTDDQLGALYASARADRKSVV